MEDLCKLKHKIRDNDFGATWCVRCGRLFTTPSGKKLRDEDKVIFKIKESTTIEK